jgi:hypothetical protein
MSDAALRTALAVFAEDLGRARDTLLADVDDIASEPIGDIDDAALFQSRSSG